MLVLFAEKRHTKADENKETKRKTKEIKETTRKCPKMLHMT